MKLLLLSLEENLSKKKIKKVGMKLKEIDDFTFLEATCNKERNS